MSLKLTVKRAHYVAVEHLPINHSVLATITKSALSLHLELPTVSVYNHVFIKTVRKHVLFSEPMASGWKTHPVPKDSTKAIYNDHIDQTMTQ